MHVDARTFRPGHALRTPVAIIGGGPIAMTISSELARGGIASTVLEAGDRHRTKQTDDFARGESVGEVYQPIHRTRVWAFAGTSQHWKDNGPFRARRFEAIDFEERDAVPHSGWPFDRDHLEPWYRRAHEWLDLGEDDYSVDRWATEQRPELPFANGPLYTSMFKLTSSETWVERWDTYTSQDAVTYVTNAHVLEARGTGNKRRLDRLDCTTLDGTTFTVDAEIVIVATGGIENARFLLLNNRQHPKGLGNEHDLVGRYFHEHPAVRTGDLHLTDPDVFDQLGLYKRHVSDEGRPYVLQGKLAVEPEVLRDRELMNAVFFLDERSHAAASNAVRSALTIKRALSGWKPWPKDFGAYVGDVAKGAGDLVTFASERIRRNGPHDVIKMMAMVEQAPNPDSRVLLGAKRDALGRPRVRLDWQFLPIDAASIRGNQEVIDEHLRELGAGRVADFFGTEQPPALVRGSWHQMGTTRMHDDPRQGVVDADLRIHDLDNVYVAGNSVLPTGGYANPTMTSLALAIRLADHLRSRGVTD